MIESGATLPYRRPPFIYGEILSRSIYTAETEPSERPQFGIYVSQGAATGVVLAFLFVVTQMITVPNVYNFLFGKGLLWILPLGLGGGTVKALVIWICSRLAGHRVAWFIRAAIAAVVLETLSRILALFFPPKPGPPVSLSWTIGLTVFASLAYAVIMGSNLHPWRALVRGPEFAGAKAVLLAGVTGFILRLTIVFMFMQSVVFMIWVLQVNHHYKVLVWTVLTFSHFTAALLVVFVRMRFWLLATVAAIITAPVVMFVLEFQQELAWMLYLIVAYLGVWAAFVFARWRCTYPVLAYLAEELRYYLID